MESSKKKASGGHRGVLRLFVIPSLLIIGMAFIYGYVMVKDKHDSEYQTTLGEMRVLSQRLTKYAGQITTGDPEAFNMLKTFHASFGRSLELLTNGDPVTGMPASPGETLEAMTKVAGLWQLFSENVKVILSRQDNVMQLRKIVGDVNDQSASLLASADDVATLMAQKGAHPEQVYIASRQAMLSQRIINNVNRVLAGDAASVTAADRFGRDAGLFRMVIKGMQDGDAALGIERVKDPDVRAKLEQQSQLFATIGEKVDAILKGSPEMFEVSEAVQKILTSSDELLKRLSDLDAAYAKHVADRPVKAWLGHTFLALAIAVLIWIGALLRAESLERLTDTEAQRKASEEQNRRNQQAILRLLDEMGDLADGDLTVNATVTEDITGAIADSVNYAIEALRTLVTAINAAVEQVSTAALETEQTANRLNQATEQQSAQISQAGTAINDMASSIEGVSKNADQLANEAQQSVAIASEGAQVVQRTITGMNTIREHIQETSKRIKRLGESSQEIGDIVELINDIAEQTNILALNAAIQAAMAGDAGRGFAVVADEVQRLAERSSGATRQIEALVKTIQTDTNEAVASMEQSTSEVVAGARLAEEAGTALTKIETVAHHLAELVQNIFQATRQQAGSAVSITETMASIQKITTQTAAGTRQTAASIGNLAKMADGLKTSVAGFKLPG